MGRKTADFIEDSKSVKTPKSSPKRKMHPNSLKNLIAPWKPGECANPGGRPKNDVAKEVAQAVFSGNREAIYEAMTRALLKGDAYVFKKLAERAFGKLTEPCEVTHIHQDLSDKELDEQIADLERKLGFAREIDREKRSLM